MFSSFPVFEQVRRPVSRFISSSWGTSMSTAASQRLVEFRQYTVQCLGLGQVPGEAVENVALSGVVGAKPILDEAQHHLVSDQFTGIHGGLGA